MSGSPLIRLVDGAFQFFRPKPPLKPEPPKRRRKLKEPVPTDDQDVTPEKDDV